MTKGRKGVKKKEGRKGGRVHSSKGTQSIKTGKSGQWEADGHIVSVTRNREWGRDRLSNLEAHFQQGSAS